MNGMLVVLCTFPDLAKARQIGTALVEKQLAACVNLLPGVESIFHWDGAVEQATEVLGIFKTTSSLYPVLAQAIAAMHPYEVPEIVALQPSAVAAPYLAWVQASVVERAGDFPHSCGAE